LPENARALENPALLPNGDVLAIFTSRQYTMGGAESLVQALAPMAVSQVRRRISNAFVDYTKASSWKKVREGLKREHGKV
jgi:hypothetical protein